jgi:hypothetical protein
MNIPKTIQYNGLTLTFIAKWDANKNKALPSRGFCCEICDKYRKVVYEYARYPEEVETTHIGDFGETVIYDPEYYHFGTECIKEVITGGVNGNTDI